MLYRKQALVRQGQGVKPTAIGERAAGFKPPTMARSFTCRVSIGKDRELVSGSGIIGEADRDLLTRLEVSDSPVEKFREFLEIRGEKLTQPRRVLVRHIFNTHKHFDADELFRDLHDAGHQVSRSTVYRTLRLLVDSGLLRELRLTNRSAFEHDYGYPAHDHLHCTSCNRIVEFRNDEILKLRDAVSLTHGFRPTGHRFLITGVCSACSRSHSPRRRLDLI
jgi:Fur family ferric uptake transcriptional regulator